MLFSVVREKLIAFSVCARKGYRDSGHVIDLKSFHSSSRLIIQMKTAMKTLVSFAFLVALALGEKCHNSPLPNKDGKCIVTMCDEE